MKVIAVTQITLDGIMQAPARADEDTRDGFQHGGWAVPNTDSASAAEMSRMPGVVGLLLGRRTYEDFYQVWPNRRDNPFTPVLNAAQKYVASTTLTEPLPWANSTLLKGDAADAVEKLRAQPGGDLVILGSGVLIQSLMRRNLIDRFVLSIHPVLLGAGRRLFPNDGSFADLRLVDFKTTSKGVVIATYEPRTSR
jgi:dihydrofolate reductase